ncbi:hypothetical protein [Micavibrio aeruginosavorus]|uniref:Uncharacterized protein n=1 Tax=Micavibrio aeruginosavorus EPB TaxID=349215 RepID=M4VJX1_9BACT|nr:hypothetical protein [Micavibrio aeruginosavorus]AGH98366.1 hypothetical protein A11S_1561 [Micavibrio aeruginosavorus EPB]
MTEQNKPEQARIEHKPTTAQRLKQKAAALFKKTPGAMGTGGQMAWSGLRKTGKGLGVAALFGAALGKKMGWKGLGYLIGIPAAIAAAVVVGGIAIPVIAAVGGFWGLKKLNNHIPLQKALGWVAIGPVIVAAGQALFQERINPMENPKDAFDYTLSQSGQNYKTLGTWIMSGGMWAVDKVNSTVDMSKVPAEKVKETAASYGLTDTFTKQTTVTLSIPDNHMAIECHEKLTSDFKKANGEKLAALKDYNTKRINEWKADPNGLITQYAAKGDVMIIYPRFNDKSQHLVAPRSYAPSSYAACPQGYERDLHSLKSWLQNKHTSR